MRVRTFFALHSPFLLDNRDCEGTSAIEGYNRLNESSKSKARASSARHLDRP